MERGATGAFPHPGGEEEEEAAPEVRGAGGVGGRVGR